MKFKIVIIFLIANLLILPNISLAQTNNSNLDNYVEYFYNRYSKHFDQFGLIYSTPEYGIEEFTEPEKIREWISLISYYKYRGLSEDRSSLLCVISLNRR